MANPQGRSTEEEQVGRGASWIGADGSLLRERGDDGDAAWSKVEVSAAAGQRLSASLGPREALLLRELAERQYLTLEQIARRYYDSYASAYRYLLKLYHLRGVYRLCEATSWVGRVIGAAGRPSQVFFLDWNGRYALEAAAPGEQRRDGRPSKRLAWDARSIATPGPNTGHMLGVNEVWSHLLAAARYSRQNGQSGASALSVGWRGEAQAIVRYSDDKGKAQTLRPDAELLLRFGSPASLQLDPQPGGSAAPLQAGPDWEGSALAEEDWPGPDALADLLAREDTTLLRYRVLLLEFESGAHHRAALQTKLERYNRLVALESVWKKRYGPRFPRLLLVTRRHADLAGAAQLWRDNYLIRPRPGSSACPVLMSSIEDLALAETRHPAGALGRCWLHAMDPDNARPRWLTLGEALGIPELARPASS